MNKPVLKAKGLHEFTIVITTECRGTYKFTVNKKSKIQ